MINVKSLQNKYIHLIFSGEEQKEPLQSFGPIARTNYIMHFVMSGCGYITINGKTYTATAGQCFLFFPNDYVYYWADQYHPWHYIWVDFEGELCEDLLHKTAFTPENFVSKPFSIHKLYSHFFNALRTVEEYEPQEIQNAALYSLLAQLIKLFPASNVEEQTKNKLAADIFRHINIYFMDKMLNVTQLTQLFNVSRSQLFRIFKTEFNTSPIDYILSLRLNQAKKLLTTTEYTIATVAEMVGFNDSLYFSRMFSQKTGLSPSDYRKQHFEDREDNFPLTT